MQPWRDIGAFDRTSSQHLHPVLLIVFWQIVLSVEHNAKNEDILA